MSKTEKKCDQGLTTRQYEALPYLISSQTIQQGCKAAGVSRTSYYSWIKRPGFKAQLNFFRKLVYLTALNVADFTVKKQSLDIFERGFLTGWKDIGNFYGISHKTARKWHKRYHMPVLRTPEGRPTNTAFELYHWLRAYDHYIRNGLDVKYEG